MREAPRGLGFDEFAEWLAQQRNDLQVPAIALVPEIGGVIAALQAQEGVAFAGMSGSGATCFALVPDAARAQEAADRWCAWEVGIFQQTLESVGAPWADPAFRLVLFEIRAGNGIRQPVAFRTDPRRADTGQVEVVLDRHGPGFGRRCRKRA